MSGPQCKQIGVPWISMLLSMAFPFCFPFPADAGLIYGRVYNEEGKVQPRLKFTVNGRPVTTDEFGGFSILLPPGNYTVESGDGRTAVIQSHPQPIRQDIYFKQHVAS